MSWSGCVVVTVAATVRPLETKPWQWLKSVALSRSTKKGCVYTAERAAE